LVFKTNIDLFTREIAVGGPSADWWQQLSLAIAWGLTFATLITLVLTPCLLVLGVRVHAAWQRFLTRLRGWRRGTPRRLPPAAESYPQAAE
jgi:multidrug efflux pump